MQASVVDAEQDAESGKILHETRTGEMAATGEIPFKLYYGSVDTTPLFLMLLGAYYERTNDAALVKQLWPAAEQALAWIERGLRKAALQLFTALFDASSFVDMNRLPELFCGFPRRPGEGPPLYPVACAPQTWASTAVFLLLQSCLGLSVEAHERRVRCSWPILPTTIDEVRIRNLVVARGEVDLTFRRYGEDVSMSIARRKGEVETIVTK